MLSAWEIAAGLVVVSCGDRGELVSWGLSLKDSRRIIKL